VYLALAGVGQGVQTSPDAGTTWQPLGRQDPGTTWRSVSTTRTCTRPPTGGVAAAAREAGHPDPPSVHPAPRSLIWSRYTAN